MTIFNKDNPFQSPLFESKKLSYLKDYFTNTNYTRFMSKSEYSVIRIVKQQKKEGEKVVFPLNQIFDPTVAIGTEQLAGREQELTCVSDSVEIDKLRFASVVVNESLVDIQTALDVGSQIRTSLLTQAEILTSNRITSQFALAFKGDPYLTNQQFTYTQLRARMLASNLDAANNGMSRSRVLLGNEYYVTHATFTEALAVGNLPIADHHLTVDHIRTLYYMANTGISGNISDVAFNSEESPIRPYQKMMRDGFPIKKYALFISNAAYRKLITDPEWLAQTSRGFIETRDQPSILYGSMYKGSIEGVMVIVINEFDKLVITNAEGNTYAYSALCGASAIGLGMGADPMFTLRSSTDYGMYSGVAHNEISGMKVLKYPSKSIGLRGNNTNLVENGIIHSFTTIA
jgi:hypothetical protein